MSFALRREQVLAASSLAFLTLPLYLFFFGWLKPMLAMAGALVLVVSTVSIFFTTPWQAMIRAPADRRSVLLTWGLLAAAVTWVGLSGIGGFGYQNVDFLKHNVVLKSLIHSSWPATVVWQDSTMATASTAPLVYYFAYYLPAAAIGKLLGWQVANWALFVWSVGGVFLAFCWFAKMCGERSWWIVPLFIFFSGLDAVGDVLLHDEPLHLASHLEWWAEFFQMSSHTSQLFWVPQHCLAAWILTAMMLWRVDWDKANADHGFFVAIGVLWSPFVALGLTPIALALMLAKRGRGSLSFQNAIGAPAIAAVSILFLISRSDHPLPSHWVWQLPGLALTYRHFVVFCVLEFGVLLFLSSLILKHDSFFKTMWLPILASLIGFQLYRFGKYHDLGMRATIPATYLLCVLVGRAIARPVASPWIKDALLSLLLLSAITGAQEIIRSGVAYQLGSKLPEAAYDLRMLGEEQWQYIGDQSKLFFRALAKVGS